jgi:hypothetical protein
MASSAICRALKRSGYNEILTATRQVFDLLDGPAMERWFAEQQPTVVVLAAKVGGIAAINSYPADFLLENLKIETHLIETAWRSGCGGCSFWAAAALTRSTPSSRSGKKPCSTVHWTPRMRGTSWPRSLASICGWPCVYNTDLLPSA